MAHENDDDEDQPLIATRHDWGRVTNFYVFDNGMAMAFDTAGQQVSECQGKFSDLADGLLKWRRDLWPGHVSKFGRDV